MKPIIGITMGDPAGIGSEIALKALAHPEVYARCTPLIIGDITALQSAAAFAGAGVSLRKIKTPAGAGAGATPGQADVLDLALLPPGGFTYGRVQPACGEAAYRYIETAIRLALAKELHAVVTGPINKQALNEAGHAYSGHTEIFAHHTGTEKYAMLLTAPGLRVTHVTTHCALREACGRITHARVLDVLRLTHRGLQEMGVATPRIAVAGLNPHSGENGLFGREEIDHIAPAVASARAEGINADGPLPPDTVFVKCRAGAYDATVAMYHDQGHIPLKLCGFRMNAATGRFEAVGGVNCTLGLPIIRTSVDHGTAFDRAGKGEASEESLLDAIDLACTMAAHRAALV